MKTFVILMLMLGLTALIGCQAEGDADSTDATEQTETVAADVLHRLGVPDFDRADHGNTGIVGVGAGEFTVDHNPAVQVDDRAALIALPTTDPFAGRCLVFPDLSVVDRVKVLLVDGDRLVGFGSAEAAQLNGRC